MVSIFEIVKDIVVGVDEIGVVDGFGFLISSFDYFEDRFGSFYVYRI